jgi:hypothetical protein
MPPAEGIAGTDGIGIPACIGVLSNGVRSRVSGLSGTIEVAIPWPGCIRKNSLANCVSTAASGTAPTEVVVPGTETIPLTRSAKPAVGS